MQTSTEKNRYNCVDFYATLPNGEVIKGTLQRMPFTQAYVITQLSNNACIGTALIWIYEGGYYNTCRDHFEIYMWTSAFPWDNDDKGDIFELCFGYSFDDDGVLRWRDRDGKTWAEVQSGDSSS